MTFQSSPALETPIRNAVKTFQGGHIFVFDLQHDVQITTGYVLIEWEKGCYLNGIECAPGFLWGCC